MDKEISNQTLRTPEAKKIRNRIFLLCGICSLLLVGWKLGYSVELKNNLGPWFIISFIILTLFTFADAFTQPVPNKSLSPLFALKLFQVFLKIIICLFAVIGILSSIYLILVFTA